MPFNRPIAGENPQKPSSILRNQLGWFFPELSLAVPDTVGYADACDLKMLIPLGQVEPLQQAKAPESCGNLIAQSDGRAFRS